MANVGCERKRYVKDTPHFSSVTERGNVAGKRDVSRPVRNYASGAESETTVTTTTMDRARTCLPATVFIGTRSLITGQQQQQ